MATTHATKLDAVAAAAVRAAPDQLAQFGFAVAHALSAQVPSVAGLAAELHPLAEEIADKLKRAKRPIILSGTSLGSAAVMQAAVNVAWALCAGGKPSELCLVAPECNSLGLRLMGGRPLSEAFEAVNTAARRRPLSWRTTFTAGRRPRSSTDSWTTAAISLC